MKTGDLITALSADSERPMVPLRALLLAILGGVLIAAVVFMAVMGGPRANFMPSLHSWRFDFKFVFTLCIAAAAAFLATRMMRPEAKPGALRLVLLVAPVLLVGAVIAELLLMPSNDWLTRLVGQNWLYCMTCIPLFSLAPLAGILLAMRTGAVTRPARAGALAGLLAAGLGGALYATHCPDDSPLFVATWYVIAIGAITALGAWLGPKVLRW
ncbi:MAG TPA: DUF1109 domain-containing protein [Rhizomicrobium sp.]|jgi:hypothetical protein|nr:DUF1109 domain-containing protein [Rhizomicrobium sp.]